MSKVKMVDALMSGRPSIGVMLVKSCPTCFHGCFNREKDGTLLFQHSVDSVIHFLTAIQVVINSVNYRLAQPDLTPYQERLYLSWVGAYDKYASMAIKIRKESHSEYDREDTILVGADYIALYSIVFDIDCIRSYAIDGVAHEKA